MSEEELVILQNIQYAIDNYNKFEFGDFQYDDIKGLVDLYIKEKEKNKELENYMTEFLIPKSTINLLYIDKEELKKFFTSRLEKYTEADDGMYKQDYLTRGELELVDRYKECKELANIILEDNIEAEVPQDCIKKEFIRDKIKWLDKQIQNPEKESIYANYIYTKNILKELLEE